MINKQRRISLFVIFFLIIGVCAFLLLNKKENPNEIELYGNIEIRQADLAFQVSGKIENMLKEEGDSVKKGELLAVLDDKDYKSNLEKSIAEAERALALKRDAESKFSRQAPLVSDSTISKQDYDSLLNAKNKAEADYKAAVAQENFSKNQLDYTKLYAPDDGIVTVRVQEPGTIVNKGQIVYSLSKTKPVWVRAFVNETDLGNIKYGMKVSVLTDTTSPKTGKKREYNGYIGYISPVAEFTPKTVQSTDLRTSLVYRIRVYINDIDEYLRQGMPTTIKVNLTSNANGNN